jgi:hypothetical protein
MALTLTDTLADEWMLMDAEDRQHTFFDYLPKTLEVWGVKGQEGWIMAVHEDKECLPVWSHDKLAVKWLAHHHPDAAPERISLNEFKQTWLPGLAKNSVGLLISPSDSQDDVVAMDAQAFIDALS